MNLLIRRQLKHLELKIFKTFEKQKLSGESRSR